MSTATSIEIFVNDKPTALAEGTSLGAFLSGLGLAGKKGLACAVNGSVVARAHWAQRGLQAGDKVLIIQATQGG